MPLLITILLLAGVLCGNNHAGAATAPDTRDTLTLFDSARSRAIPIAIYPPAGKAVTHPPLVILSHGYWPDRNDIYLGYSYIAETLAAAGYFVVSIQHDLPTDERIPTQGVPQVVRRPFWERGADNIHFVIGALKSRYASPDFTNTTLIGHSNGGDMTALFVTKYPGEVQRIITLDNRRMALPRTANPRVFSLRSNDQPADEGVLPTAAEAQQYHMVIIPLPDTEHNNMTDAGSKKQKAAINRYILQFLKEK